MENLDCKHFDFCGGCAHKADLLETKLNEKYNVINSYITHSKIDKTDDYTLSIDKDRQGEYRNRMDFAFCEAGPGQREQGKFYKINQVENCLISNTKLNKVLGYVQAWYDKYKSDIEVFDTVEKTGTLRYSVIRTPEFTDDSSVTFVLNKDSKDLDDVKYLIEFFAKEYDVTNVLIIEIGENSDVSTSFEYEVIKGTPYLQEKFNEITYRFHTQGFFQVNSKMAINMVDHVKQILSINPKDILIDLFGGIGTFGLYCGESYKEVHIIDNNVPNIDAANVNIELNKKENVYAKLMDAKKIGEYYSQYVNTSNFDLILDPPRAGLHKKTREFLNEIKPDRLVYISCNPKNIIKEFKKLKRNYLLKSTKVFDMFPRTNHVEVIFELKLKEQ